MDKRALCIIGSGPAGLTAAIYAARANLEPCLFEGFLTGPGGQLTTTTEVENFPGFPEGIMGPVLMDQMRKQALRFSTHMVSEDVERVDLSSYPYKVYGKSTIVETKALIIATGAASRTLDVPGAKEFWQKGVSTCAVCDGAAPIFRGKELFVIGGGDSAVEEAIFLTKYAKKVYLVHRKDQLRASKVMVARVTSHPKVEILWNHVLKEIKGEKTVSSIVLTNLITGADVVKEGGGLFFAIGHIPNTHFLQGQILLTETGYIVTKNGSHTSKEGVFAAGDVQDAVYRQAITSAGSGCMAALDAEKWLTEKGVI